MKALLESKFFYDHLPRPGAMISLVDGNGRREPPALSRGADRESAKGKRSHDEP
jgi:hypothetical protein